MTQRYRHACHRCAATLLLLLAGVGLAGAQSRTYTLDADFDEGILLNVNHDAPNNDQLQLNQIAEPFPFINIAASDRGTIVRIDVNTGQILGEYQTAPNGRGRNPSRTTVDQRGNVWVSNRDEMGDLSQPFLARKGSVARVGLIVGGTRVDADGTPNANGQYLKPPYKYSTCLDRDGDNLIKTSRGLGNILPWTNTGGADDNGGVSTAEDECIINYTRVTGTGTRTLAVDRNNDVWVGGIRDRDHEKLDGVTGQPVPGTQFNLGCGGYGGLVDRNGILWSARPLLRFDPATMTGECYPSGHGNYGLGAHPITGHVFHSSNRDDGEPGPIYHLYELDSQANVLNIYDQPFQGQGLVVDGNGHVWVMEIFGNEVAHYAPDPNDPSKLVLVGRLQGLAGGTGLSVDANGKIWVAEQGNNQFGYANRGGARIDPNGGPMGAHGYRLGAIDLVVGLGAGAGAYNYSDMTGFVVISTTVIMGTWTVVYDGGMPAVDWGTVSWNSFEPRPGQSVTVEVRAAETQAGLTSALFVPVVNGNDFSGTGIAGRYIEVRTTLTREPQEPTPILYDLTISAGNEPPVCVAQPSIAMIWPPNHKMVDIGIVGVTDPDGDPVTITVTSITQDEPLNTVGDGNTPEYDGAGLGTSVAQVRAERTGTPRVPGNGRVYQINYSASDGQGGTCTGKVTTCVPHDMSKPCIDSGQNYVSTGNALAARKGKKSGAIAAENDLAYGVSNYPNPFNPTTTISFTLPMSGHVRLVVFDLTGREVARVIDGAFEAGEHEVHFDASAFPSGVYFYRMEAADFVATRRMVLLK